MKRSVPTETLPAKVPHTDMVALVPLHRKFYLSLDEAAALSGLPKSYIQRCIKDGRLKATKLGGWKIRRSDLEAI
jgi:excisionase family DNA binding protein